MKGKQIKKIPSNDAVIPLHRDSLLHVVSLPSAMSVLHTHRLQSGKVSNKDFRVSKSLHAAACAQSGASIQDASVATSIISPDGRVACHKIWGAVLGTNSTTPCIVMPAVALDFENILRASGSKNDCTWMFAESLSNFYEE
eukprot:3897050-Ditylum_brightwellii.AAC.1